MLQYFIMGVSCAIAVMVFVKILEVVNMNTKHLFIRNISRASNIPYNNISITGTAVNGDLTLHMLINRRWERIFGDVKFKSNKQLYAQFMDTGLKHIHLLKRDYSNGNS